MVKESTYLGTKQKEMNQLNNALVVTKSNNDVEGLIDKMIMYSTGRLCKMSTVFKL